MYFANFIVFLQLNAKCVERTERPNIPTLLFVRTPLLLLPSNAAPRVRI